MRASNTTVLLFIIVIAVVMLGLAYATGLLGLGGAPVSPVSGVSAYSGAQPSVAVEHMAITVRLPEEGSVRPHEE
jgi:hypothetical protein